MGLRQSNDREHHVDGSGQEITFDTPLGDDGDSGITSADPTELDESDQPVRVGQKFTEEQIRARSEYIVRMVTEVTTNFLAANGISTDLLRAKGFETASDFLDQVEQVVAPGLLEDLLREEDMYQNQALNIDRIRDAAGNTLKGGKKQEAA
jgi:hypothetical protein